MFVIVLYFLYLVFVFLPMVPFIIYQLAELLSTLAPTFTIHYLDNDKLIFHPINGHFRFNGRPLEM